MKLFVRAISALPCVALLVAAAPFAHADSYGPLTVTLWTGQYDNGVSDVANAANTPTITPTATFTYTGPINFTYSGPNSGNTFGNFIGAANEAFISSSSVPLATLNNDLLSTPGETGTAINSFFQITGTMYGNGTVGIASDDGSCLYLGGSAVSGLCFPNPQMDTGHSATVSAGAGTAFTLDYVESNGAPADLVVTGASFAATPEPSSIVMLGTGLISAAGMLRRRMAV